MRKNEIRRTLRASGETPRKTRGGPHLRAWLARRADNVARWTKAGRRGYPHWRPEQRVAPTPTRVHPLPLSVADATAAEELHRRFSSRRGYWLEPTASADRAADRPEYHTPRRDVAYLRPATWGQVVVPSRIVRGSRRTAVVTAWDFQAGAMVQRRLNAPRGYTLGADDEGVYLSRHGHTVHLDTGCWRPGGMRAAAAEWRRLERVRRAAARSADATLRIPRPARSASVTLADAAAAGHCRAGTVAWCRARGIPTRGATLAALAPHVGDERVAQVVRRVVARAIAA